MRAFMILFVACFAAAANGAVLAASDKIAAFIAADDDAALTQFSTNYVVPNTRSEGGALKGPSADSDFAAVVLQAHTASRKERKASNMMHLTWDQQLADLAAEHAEKCEYEHGTLFLSDKTKVGQNMARASWSKAQGEFPAAIHVDGWHREIKYFNNNSATCNEMGECGHYSQMVWASTSKVGCAHKICSERQSSYDMIVCNYLPFGNEPGPAYKTEGDPCSNCNLKGGTACVENQCVDCSENPSLARDHDCRACDQSLCLDQVSFCGNVLEDICNHQMWRSFAAKNCRQFCNMCSC